MIENRQHVAERGRTDTGDLLANLAASPQRRARSASSMPNSLARDTRRRYSPMAELVAAHPHRVRNRL